MRKLAAGAISAALVAATSVTAVVPAQAAPHNRDYYVQNFCRDHPGARDCHDWRSNGRHWDNQRYHQFYQDNHSALPAVVGGIFGFALGAAAASAAHNSNNSSYHVQACEQHYHSYNPRTDMYLGYDGNYHRCTY